jgi:hypothetical protein
MTSFRRSVLFAVMAASALRCSADEQSVEEVNPSASDAIRASMPPCGTALGDFDGTTAYSNGANTGTGVSCRGSGAFGLQYQCVELVMRHFQTHWGYRWRGNAQDLLNNAPRDRVDVYGNGDGAHPPVPGDLIVWQEGEYGHTALVTGVRPGAVDILEQNVGGGARASLPYDGRTIGSRWGGWRPQGWGHARANPARPPAPTCPVHCEGNTLVAADCGRADCGASSQCRGDRCVAMPRGSLDAAQCDLVRGWAQDPTAATSAIDVDLYFDGPAGSGAPSVRVRADGRREDLCAAVGSCEHAFSLDTPTALRDGREHRVYAYALAPDGRAQPMLDGAPRPLRCTVARVADFNGDGRDDVVQYRSDRATMPVCLSLGSGWSCRNLAAEGWDGGNQGSSVVEAATPLLGRFNDDALADVFQFRADLDRLPVCLSLGSGWSCRGLAAGYSGGVAEGNAGSGVYVGSVPLVGDFNGDHRDDVIQYRDGSATLPVCLSLGSGWSCRNMAASHAGQEPAGNEGSGVHRGGTPLVGDFDGDGHADLIQYNPAWTSIPVCLSLGSGWSCRNLAASYAGGEGAGNEGSGVYAGSTPIVADFNGDGRSDVIQYRAGSATLPVCLSLTGGWSCRNLAAGLPASATATAVGIDFDGDGRGDVVQYDARGETLPVCLSLGTGWSCRDLRADLAAGTTLGNNGSGVFRGGAPMVGDFNGDGRADLMQFQPQGWEIIPVCLNLGSGWACRALHADYAGGAGAGNAGSGVY